jgi:hypothetical protein
LYYQCTVLSTTGYGDLSPGDPFETAFFMGSVFVCAMFLALFIGMFTTMFVNQDTASQRFHNKLHSLELFLSERKISKQVQGKCEQVFLYLWNNYSGVHPQKLYEELPEHLNVELKFHNVFSMFDKEEFFQGYSPYVLSQIAGKMTFEIYEPDVAIINYGQPSTFMLMLNTGTWKFFKEGLDLYSATEANQYPADWVLPQSETIDTGGRMVGELALVGEKVRTIQLKATGTYGTAYPRQFQCVALSKHDLQQRHNVA